MIIRGRRREIPSRTSRRCTASIACSARRVLGTVPVVWVPQPQNLFGALVNWVENGVAPSSILASGPPIRTRPVCPYPQTAIYNGSGSTDDASNFHCGGNLETQAVICNDMLTKYKDEVKGPIDRRGTGAGNCKP